MTVETKLTPMQKVDELIERGKSKGELTYKEVIDTLGNDALDVDQMEVVYDRFEDADINVVEEIDSVMQPILDKFGIKLINKGVSPTTTYKNIKLLPKRRYHLMANYLWGILSDVMMRETAGIQVGIDYKSEEDAMKKFRIANIMMPFATAMYANSRYRGGVDTGYKSFRALAWLNTDNERCGFATKFHDGMSFKDYVETLLDTPMIFINRENRTVNLNGRLTFRQFMNKGFEAVSYTHLTLPTTSRV